jgi:hypothetical protein
MALGPTTSATHLRGDRVLNSLVKRQPARRHRNAVKPNLETAGREILVQAGNEGRGPIEWIDVRP